MKKIDYQKLIKTTAGFFIVLWSAYSCTSGRQGEILCQDTTLQGKFKNSIRVKAGSSCHLNGFVYIKSGATFTAEAGSKIYADTKNAALIIEPLAKIHVKGTKENPVVFTSNQNTPQAGDWGGLIIYGNAGMPLKTDGDTTDNMTGVKYGGGIAMNENESSGEIRYMRIEYAGNPSLSLGPASNPQDENFDSLALNAVGSKTKLEYIQIFKSGDDGIKIRGGNARLSHLMLQECAKEHLELKSGARANIQYLYSYVGTASKNQFLSVSEKSELKLWNATILGTGSNVGDEILTLEDDIKVEINNSFFARFNKKEFYVRTPKALDALDYDKIIMRANLFQNITNSSKYPNSEKGRINENESLDGHLDAQIGSNYTCQSGDPGYDSGKKRCDIHAENKIVTKYSSNGLAAGHNVNEMASACSYLSPCDGSSLVPGSLRTGLTPGALFDASGNFLGAFNTNWASTWARKDASTFY